MLDLGSKMHPLFYYHEVSFIEQMATVLHTHTLIDEGSLYLTPPTYLRLPAEQQETA